MNGIEGFGMQVLVNGNPVAEYSHNGLTYIEGRDGSRFKIRLHNPTSERVLAVVTLDGLNVINGEFGDLNKNKSGYVIPAFKTITIDGWRRGLENAAEFVFTAKSESYAEQMDKGGNQGVVAVAFFKEVVKTPVYFSKGLLEGALRGGDTPRSFSFGGEKGLTKSSFDMGAGYGRQVSSRVQTTEFEAQSQPCATLALYYMSSIALRNAGIMKQPTAVAETVCVSNPEPISVPVPEGHPDPFHQGQGAKAPKGWDPRTGRTF